MVAKRPHPDEFGYAELAPLILQPLRMMRGVSPPEMAERIQGPCPVKTGLPRAGGPGDLKSEALHPSPAAGRFPRPHFKSP